MCIAGLATPIFTMKKPGTAEGVGFEPTVGLPTLDFESSALNRPQPPFLEERRKRRTSNVQHPKSNATVFEIRRSALGVERCIQPIARQPIARLAPTHLLGQDSLPHECKKCYNFALAMSA